jgi:hypothetical protein
MANDENFLAPWPKSDSTLHQLNGVVDHRNAPHGFIEHISRATGALDVAKN